MKEKKDFAIESCPLPANLGKWPKCILFRNVALIMNPTSRGELRTQAYRFGTFVGKRNIVYSSITEARIRLFKRSGKAHKCARAKINHNRELKRLPYDWVRYILPTRRYVGDDQWGGKRPHSGSCSWCDGPNLTLEKGFYKFNRTRKKWFILLIYKCVNCQRRSFNPIQLKRAIHESCDNTEVVFDNELELSFEDIS